MPVPKLERALWTSTMPSLHRLVAKPTVVDRVPWLERKATAREVIHLGFVDVDRLEDKTASGTWLHERLARVARHVVGIDLDPSGIASAREAGYEAHACDLENREAVASLGVPPAELVIAGELIEHLDCPGEFLEAVKVLVAPGGTLVLTTPNATAFTNFIVALSRREWASPHHVCVYTWRTMASLLERHQWRLSELLFYRRGKRMGPEANSRPTLAAAFNAYERGIRPLLNVFPLVADGLIVVAERSQPRESLGE